VKSPWFFHFSKAPLNYIQKIGKFYAVDAKHRRITYVCSPLFENWLAALYSTYIPL
jgi:hypothetical protein